MLPMKNYFRKIMNWWYGQYLLIETSHLNDRNSGLSFIRNMCKYIDHDIPQIDRSDSLHDCNLSDSDLSDSELFDTGH